MTHLREWWCADIPLMDYEEAWALQIALIEGRRLGRIPDVVLLLEHPPVFTLGRRGGEAHFLVDENYLKSRGIPVFHAERGGEVTHHGPGQLVGYPIVDLRANGWKVVDFVGALEEVMIRTAAHWGIRAERNSLNRGVWVGMDKLGSIGIAVRRGISFHGFALNVNTDLEPFQWVNPCGLQGVQMTSMERLLGDGVSMRAVRDMAKEVIEEVFNVFLQEISHRELDRLMGESTHRTSREVGTG
jgi:lipoate-protein ligase B